MKRFHALLLCALLLPLSVRAIDDTITVIDGFATNLAAFLPSGTNNLVLITNGGTATMTSFASKNTARSNAIVVVGSGSALNPGATSLGFANAGISNALVIRDGGRVRGPVTLGGTNNLALVDNTSVLTAFTLSGRSNTLVFTNSTVTAPL